LLLTAEDGISDTVVPRLIANEGDKSLVTVIEGMRGKKGDRMFNLQADIQELEKELDRIGNVRMIIIDPISAYLGSMINSHKDQDVRGLLGPVAKLAEEKNIAVIGVMHLNKSLDLNAIYRVSGSMAFVAAARAVWLVFKDEEDKSLRHFNFLKCNLTGEAIGFSFRIEEKKVVYQEGGMTPSVNEALAPG
jgi:RecA-family ATPase